MSNNVTIFFPTRNRPNGVKKTLDSIVKFCPACEVVIGNCSSPQLMQETSDVIKEYSKAKEIQFYPDPGASVAYNELFLKHINTEFAIWLADDVEFVKGIDGLANKIKHCNLDMVGLPMIDDLSNSLDFGTPWAQDKFKCAIWIGENGTRVAHHALIRVSHYKKFGGVVSIKDELPIDNFCESVTDKHLKFWADDGAYLYHKRLLDDTRVHAVMHGDVFRIPIDDRIKGGMGGITKAIDRDNKIWEKK